MTKRILITGMSGTGKSAVIAELARRGHRAIDLDVPEWSHWVDAAQGDDLTPRDGQDWVWREDRVRGLLLLNERENLFVSGCAENMDKLFDVIDTIVLLSAPLETIVDRLRGRSGEGYGQTAGEQRKVAELIEAVEPLLRESSDFEIDTRQPVAHTVDQILSKVA
ncbi:AAA family ATPase [Ensifer aridi]|uniref:AAA family ATPase n=1 Tax=Ensifer aridi TaxID=1708715 RepID=UPI000A119F1B|nr:AAA family ATPase [Ensifer aridi]